MKRGGETTRWCRPCAICVRQAHPDGGCKRWKRTGRGDAQPELRVSVCVCVFKQGSRTKGENLSPPLPFLLYCSHYGLLLLAAYMHQTMRTHLRREQLRDEDVPLVVITDVEVGEILLRGGLGREDAPVRDTRSGGRGGGARAEGGERRGEGCAERGRGGEERCESSLACNSQCSRWSGSNDTEAPCPKP